MGVVLLTFGRLACHVSRPCSTASEMRRADALETAWCLERTWVAMSWDSASAVTALLPETKVHGVKKFLVFSLPRTATITAQSCAKKQQQKTVHGVHTYMQAYCSSMASHMLHTHGKHDTAMALFAVTHALTVHKCVL